MLNPDDMMIDNEEYRRLKKEQYKQKQVKQQLKKNQKASLGFGYTYQQIKFDD